MPLPVPPITAPSDIRKTQTTESQSDTLPFDDDKADETVTGAAEVRSLNDTNKVSF